MDLISLLVIVLVLGVIAYAITRLPIRSPGAASPTSCSR
jgi:hypothetical protein